MRLLTISFIYVTQNLQSPTLLRVITRAAMNYAYLSQQQSECDCVRRTSVGYTSCRNTKCLNVEWL